MDTSSRQRVPGQESRGVWSRLMAALCGLLFGFWYGEDTQLDGVRRKRVLVTGASRGVGEQLAYQFATHGAQLVLTARSEEALNQVLNRCRELSGEGVSHYAVVADMGDMLATKTVVQEAVKLLGGLDMLVLNHITTSVIQPYTGSDDDILALDKQMDVNFRSHAYLTSHALPALTASGGRIVVVNSLVGRIGHPYLPSYAASKFALDGFFCSLRNDFRAEGTPVSVTVCYLGLIGTDQSIQQLRQSGSQRLLNNFTPESPREAARAIVWAAVRGREELHWPYLSVRPLTLLYSALPRLVDRLMRYLTARS